MDELPAAVLKCPEWRKRQRLSSQLDARGDGSAALFAPEPGLGRSPRVVFKAVAVESLHGVERYYSLFAGKRVEYKLGQRVSGMKKSDGLFCFDNVAAAQCARVPAKSMMRNSPRTILACSPATDDGVRLKGGKLRFGALVPMQRLDVEARIPSTWKP